MTPSTIKTGAMMTMARRRLLCYRVVVVATTLCSLVVGFSIQHHPRQRIRPASSASDDYEETSKYTKRRPRRIRPKRSAAATAQTEIRKAEAKQRHAQALQDPTLLSNVVFAERDDLHPSTKRALTETMGLRQMTEIQLKTYAAAFTGKSVLGRSKTGTGKSLAFLLPSLERLLQGNISLYHPGRNIGVLVIAPTRELAIQIADQARLLLTYHSQDFTVMDMYGGTKLSRDTALLNKRLPTILVATPGRLLDHIEQTRVGARRFSDILSQTQIVVLDETDRLLVDMGFQRDVKKILSFLPRPAKRQTLMFSATLPKRLVKNMKDALSDDYVQVDCVDTHRKNTSASRNGSTVTNIRVKQTFLLLPNMDSYMSKLIEILLDAIRSTPNDYKILVFFPANKLVKFFADVCNAINDSTLPQIQQLHSHMTQSARQRTSTDFAKVQQAILFTSDVSARGVDYPDVTHVIQYGSADSRVIYTHRLGRTGRAGRSGEGLLVLLPFEKSLVASLRRSGVQENAERDSNATADDVNEMLVPVRNKIASGNVKLKSSAAGAYRAFLAYYISRADSLGVSPETIVDCANHFCESMGLTKVPALSTKTAKKLNLLEMKGIYIDTNDDVA